MLDGEDVERAAGKFGSVLRLLGALAGGVFGAAVLLFFSGSLAQRAQFDVAGLPFVFVDYWAYVEIGITGVIKSARLVLNPPALLVGLLTLSILLIFLLEWARFRDFLERPHWLLAANLLHLVLVALLGRQLFAVSHLTQADAGGAANGAGSLPKTEIIPARWPFHLGMPPRAPIPDRLFSDFASHSVTKLREQLATELESTLHGRQYLHLRPAGPWETPDGANSDAPVSFFRGPRTASASRTTATAQEQAEFLYQRVVQFATVLVWVLVLLAAWERRLRHHLGEIDVSEPSTASTPMLVRLREETWWVVRHLTLPASALALGFAAVVMLPESYGALAMPRIGQELVEVVVQTDASSTPAEKPPTAESPEEPTATEKPTPAGKLKLDRRLKLQLANLADRYSLESGTDREELEDEWREWIEKIAGLRTPRSLEFLTELIAMVQPYARGLSDIAAEEATRLRGNVPANLRGFILYYPRSPEDQHLRLLVPNLGGPAIAGNLVPIDRSTVKELRVVGDARTGKMVTLLQEMNSQPSSERQRAVVDLELTGDWSLLEIALVNTRDPDPEIHGPALTTAARYARELDPQGSWSRLRRARAIDVLLGFLADTNRSPETRATAATSLFYITTPEHTDRVGAALLATLPRATESTPPGDWVVGGRAITSLGKIQHAPSIGTLLSLLTNALTPATIRRTIPSALTAMEQGPAIIPALLDYARSESVPTPHLPTVILSLGQLARGQAGPDASTLAETLWTIALNKSAQADDDRTFTQIWEAATMSLSILRDVPHLQEIVRSRTKLGQRGASRSIARAAQALGKIEVPSSETLLLELALDEDGSDLFSRLAAILSLGSFHDESVADRLFQLWIETTEAPTRAAIKEALIERIRSGSGSARAHLSEIEELEDRMPRRDLQQQLEELFRGLRSSPDRDLPEPDEDLPPPEVPVPPDSAVPGPRPGSRPRTL